MSSLLFVIFAFSCGKRGRGVGFMRAMLAEPAAKSNPLDALRTGLSRRDCVIQPSVVRRRRATLGNGTNVFNPERVESIGANGDATRSGLNLFFGFLTQGSSCLATAGLNDLNPFGIRGRRQQLWPPVPLFSAGIYAHDFTQFALGVHREGAAADFAVGGEKLARHRGVEFDLTVLAAVRTLDSGGFLHTICALCDHSGRESAKCLIAKQRRI